MDEPRRSITRRALGSRGEEIAARFLSAAGYRILARNWRVGRYEIDIVARRGGDVVFVEVKTRRPGPQPAAESITPSQRRNIRHAAAAWIRSHPHLGSAFRFDLVAVTWPEGGPPRVEHIPAAFDAHGP
jgi:putative endonuclease